MASYLQQVITSSRLVLKDKAYSGAQELFLQKMTHLIVKHHFQLKESLESQT